jgi:hypothetical protein
MKTLIAFILALTMFSNVASASLVICDWKKIKANTDGTYTYSKELNVCVGHLVYNQDGDNRQIEDLNKALVDLNLALEKADEQSRIWQATSTQEIQKINEIKAQESSSRWITFGLGFIAGSALIYGASRISSH